MITRRTLDAINELVINAQTSLTEVLVSLVEQQHPLTDDLCQGLRKIINAVLLHAPAASFEATLKTMTEIINSQYFEEIKILTDLDTGWPFSATHTNSDQLEGFLIENMAGTMKRLAGRLWHFLDVVVPRFAQDFVGTSEDARKHTRVRMNNRNCNNQFEIYNNYQLFGAQTVGPLLWLIVCICFVPAVHERFPSLKFSRSFF
jgi:hypothetical protein